MFEKKTVYHKKWTRAVLVFSSLFVIFVFIFYFVEGGKKIVELTNKSKKVMINLLQTEKTRQFFCLAFPFRYLNKFYHFTQLYTLT